MAGKKAVFLDRDGVLNEVVVRDGKPYPPPTAEEMRILPGVPQAVKRLHDAGWMTIVVTNQPDAVTGKTTMETVNAIHDTLRAAMPLDDILVCLCVDGPDCPCYKPKPGMLHEAAERHGIDLSASIMVGDRWRDVGAGVNAGCRQTIYIDRGYAETLRHTPDLTVKDLPEAADAILSPTTHP